MLMETATVTLSELRSWFSGKHLELVGKGIYFIVVVDNILQTLKWLECGAFTFIRNC